LKFPNSPVRVIQQSGEWANVQFQDPQFGLRTGYIERRLIRLQLDPAQPRYAEISRSLGMPVGSIGPIRGRALRKLRCLLRDLEPDEPTALAV